MDRTHLGLVDILANQVRKELEREKAIPEKKPKADNTKRWKQAYATIDKSYEDMKAPKRADEDSAMVSLRYVAENMIECCDVIFDNFPGLLEKPDYKAKVIEVMQEPKQYILKLEGGEL